jgi:hypothetical protein|tara:strand:+ start:881 stop:1573 length:693 start_codon:yes stop_codon:yes gene_type:complete
MALSDITLKTLRSDLQSRLNEIAPDKFSKEELNHWVNMSQFDVAMRLSAISNIWYGDKQTIDLSSAAADAVTEISLPANATGADIMKIIKIVDGTSGAIVPFVEDNKIHSLKSNSNYDSAHYCNWFGEKVYVFRGTSGSGLSATSEIYVIRKPDEMTSDSGTMDVPTEYYDLVVLSAMAKATSKLNMIGVKQQLDADVAQKFNEIRALYAQEVQVSALEERVGVQTPRNR